MSAPRIILDNLPSLCQKLSDLVEVWRSYNKNNFACFFETRCIHNLSGSHSKIRATHWSEDVALLEVPFQALIIFCEDAQPVGLEVKW